MWPGNCHKTTSKKYRYQAIKQKEQSKFKIQKTRLSHETMRHKWQDNMNLYEKSEENLGNTLRKDHKYRETQHISVKK